MLNTDKWGCRQIAAALNTFGISQVVTSPGSRNAPLIMAVQRHPALHVYSVIDERSAAFIALGMAEISAKPVALICTSGTALLNYAPAVAEAYYKNIPLIVISADRPREWIDQADSQTMRQPGALANIVKGSYAIKGEAENENDKWYVNRTINDAIINATHNYPGPIHLNVALDAPLTTETECGNYEQFRKISCITLPNSLPTTMARELCAELCNKKILIVGGFQQPVAAVNRSMSILATLPNVAIMAEALANIHCHNIITNVDATLASISQKDYDTLRPDILITFGGAIVSATLKTFLRNIHPTEHWHVGKTPNVVDCYKSLTRRVDITPEGFFPKMATSLAHLTKIGKNSDAYAQQWQAKATQCENATSIFRKNWNGPHAVQKIINAMPSNWNLQVSNGMSVRYAQLSNTLRVHRIDGNRGVSGIDGSVSTAVGAAINYSKPTLLITGDMSLQYDLGALTSNYITPNLKIVVMNNNGGGIFHFVKTTATLPELPQLFNGMMKLPVKQLAEAFGFKYLCANDYATLKTAFAQLIKTDNQPVMMEVITDSHTDAEIMKEFYEQYKN